MNHQFPVFVHLIKSKKKRLLILSLLFSTTIIVICTNKKEKGDREGYTTLSDSIIITNHLRTITKTDGFRNYQNVELLDQTADYIRSVFAQYADTCYFQTYEAKGMTYKNVVCRFGKSEKPIIVVGAHYDVCGNQEGADDNASGVVGLLELARLLQSHKLNYPVELVAYSLEEPPFFKKSGMGSYIHAESLKDANTPVYGMISLEMIGFFSTQKKSQTYPVGLLKWKYGSVGDFILLAKKSGSGDFVKNISNTFEEVTPIKTKTISISPRIAEIDFSDHLNYWKFGYDALMITNTAFYRNPNYHEKTDTMETLDIGRMARVIDAVYLTLTQIGN